MTSRQDEYVVCTPPTTCRMNPGEKVYCITSNKDLPEEEVRGELEFDSELDEGRGTGTSINEIGFTAS